MLPGLSDQKAGHWLDRPVPTRCRQGHGDMHLRKDNVLSVFRRDPGCVSISIITN